MPSTRQKMLRKHHNMHKRERQFRLVAITVSTLALSIPLIISYFC